ncbi:amidohydrolase family protein [Pseudaminobacter sp. 19-2017]|uniref:Amidohydrolase family protein n=1 Tax=Pseudaminobacter soli (ex Zhang et al. 2022) TaxID=2831468 RepID=A0A942E214_9HYPH|nr:amidohydrolase family protein [Pseudaminobacter soli]MBS3652389.1 amidohydrolase family protein [Pseudaminobacter soli]
MNGIDQSRQDCVIEAGWALVERNGEQTLERDVSIVIRGNEIVDIRPGPVRGWEVRVDAGDCLVLPGFISGHTHTAVSSPARGLIEGGRFMDRPVEMAMNLDDEQLDALSAYNIAEILKSGCTTFVEMSASLRHAESFVRVANAWGIRGYISIIAPNMERLYKLWYRDNDQMLFDSVPETLQEIEAARQFGLALNKADGDLLQGQMAIHAADTQTPETLKAAQLAAEELGNGIHIHLAQRLREVEVCERLWGMRPVAWLESLGFFDQPVIAAHLYKMDTVQDPPILKRHGVNYVHCACMASLLHQGAQPYPEALAGGLNISLGIDQISNDYVENIKLATLNGQLRTTLLEQYSEARMQRPQIADAVRAATIGGAKMLRRDDLGRLAPGAKADLCAIDVTKPLSGLGALPPEPLHHLLYSSGRNVRHVMTNGRFQVLAGKLVVADEDRVVAEGGEVSKEIWKRLESENWFESAPPPNSRG